MLAASVQADDQQPNILFIYTDDQSHRTVGRYDEAFDWVRTPNIDQLPARGCAFSQSLYRLWHAIAGDFTDRASPARYRVDADGGEVPRQRL